MTVQLDYGEIERAGLREGSAARVSAAVRLREWAYALFTAGVVLLVIVPLVSGEGTSWFSPSSPALLIRGALTVLLAALNVYVRDRHRDRVSAGPEALASAVVAEAQRFTGHGWQGRTMKLGLGLGTMIGLPVGLLLITLPQLGAVTLLDRFFAFASFFAATIAWCIPMAFVIRWISLRSIRRYLA